jgi:hypothetical protein
MKTRNDMLKTVRFFTSGQGTGRQTRPEKIPNFTGLTYRVTLTFVRAVQAV